MKALAWGIAGVAVSTLLAVGGRSALLSDTPFPGRYEVRSYSDGTTFIKVDTWTGDVWGTSLERSVKEGKPWLKFPKTSATYK